MTARGGAGWRGVEEAENINRHHTALGGERVGGFTYRYSAVASQGKYVGIRSSNMVICAAMTI